MPPPRIALAGLLSRLRIQRSALPFRFPRMFQTHEYRGGTKRRPTVFGSAVLTAQFFLTLHFVTRYFFSLSVTSGISMVPTIPHSWRSTPWILISHLPSHMKGLKVGDVVTYKHPVITGSQGCKRIVGMPGDYVCVMAPGKPMDYEEKAGGATSHEEAAGGERREKFASYKDAMIRVPEGHCWLAGDNLEFSRDSRNFGPIPLNLVNGKVVALLLPWAERKWLGHEEPGALVGPVERREEDRWVAI